MSTEKKTTRREALGILAFGTIGVTVGCGGGGGTRGGGGRKASVRLSIDWPAEPVTRYIPTYAASLFFELYPKNEPNKRSTLVVNRPTERPAEQTVAFSGLFVEGDYVLAGAARVQVDGQGASVASGLIEIAVRDGMAPVGLTLGSTLRRLEIVGQPLKATIGVKQTLVSGAFDPDNRSLLLPTSALNWSIVSGATFGTITTAGELTPTAVGTLRVRVAEPGANVAAEADVAVSEQAITVDLASTAWPKASADAGNTGRSSGQGATGVEKWVLDLGDPVSAIGTVRLFSAPTVGGSLVFVTDTAGETVAVRQTNGGVAWRVALPIASGVTPMLLSDNTLVCGGDRGGIVGLDALTGLERWRNASPSVSGLNFDPKRQIVVNGSGGIGTYDPATGRAIGSVPLSSNANTVAVGPSGTLFYVARGAGNLYELRAYDPNAGRQLWAQTLSSYSNIYTPVVAADNTVYYYGNKNDGAAWLYLWAIDGATGTILAEQRVNGEQVAIGRNGTVYAPADGKIVAYSPRLSVLWEFTAPRLNDGYDTFANPKEVIVGGDDTVYFVSNGNYVNARNYLLAVNGADGTQKWRYDYTGRSFNGLTLGADGTVYFAANASPAQDGRETIGKIYAVR
jgi:hypothetical protein